MFTAAGFRDVTIAETITLPIQMAGLTRPVRVGALFIGYAAALAMLLTAIGLYGALAFAVSRQLRVKPGRAHAPTGFFHAKEASNGESPDA